MARPRPKVSDQLTPVQRAELLGRDPWAEIDMRVSAFPSEEARREAWRVHRAELLAEMTPGDRAAASELPWAEDLEAQ